MKKLVNAPISNRIFWATVNEENGTMNPQTRVDVTDNAIDVVFYHLINLERYQKISFAGYEIPKIQNPDETITICAYDSSKYIAVGKDKYAEMEKELIRLKEENNRLKTQIEDSQLYHENVVIPR